MQVILTTDMERLGVKNDVVTVKNGYGRNYLLPKRLAIIANTRNLNILKENTRQSNYKMEQMLGKIREAIAKMDASAIKVGAKVGTSGKIFGSVTNIQLADAIKKATGLEVDRRKITIEDEIKALGTFKAIIDFHPDLKHELSFEVVGE